METIWYREAAENFPMKLTAMISLSGRAEAEAEARC